ncbi:MAG TPA: phosphoglucomutase/phosphomannomutase family protein, partial [Blastocatellia bacterium]|nr:phosphoglucomutase/phosphomannomutase family protein [Blastocatellia bacterium]
MATIKFGTDGWRARIAEDFTFANVEKVSQAVAEYVKTQAQSEGRSGERRMLVGYDRRFASDLFAARTAEVLAGNGFIVDLFSSDVPTPVISFDVKDRGLDGGIVITASHNPPDFNGYKFKAPYGGAATPKITSQIESYLGLTPVSRLPIDEAKSKGLINIIEPTAEAYRAHVASKIDLNAIRNVDALIVADPMYGTGGRWIESFLSGGKLHIETIRAERDPLFGGVFPEPMPQHLGALSQAIRKHGALVGLATDGDADRVGAMDENGEYINTHQILAIFLLHLVRNKGEKGSVVRTFSQSVIVRRIAESYGF